MTLPALPCDLGHCSKAGRYLVHRGGDADMLGEEPTGGHRQQRWLEWLADSGNSKWRPASPILTTDGGVHKKSDPTNQIFVFVSKEK